jgi:hypothetical protein
MSILQNARHEAVAGFPWNGGAGRIGSSKPSAWTELLNNYSGLAH